MDTYLEEHVLSVVRPRARNQGQMSSMRDDGMPSYMTLTTHVTKSPHALSDYSEPTPRASGPSDDAQRNIAHEIRTLEVLLGRRFHVAVVEPERYR
jgi:hypothetical protein